CGPSRLQQIVTQDQIDTGSEEDRQFNIETAAFLFSVKATVTFEKDVVEETAPPESRDTRTEALAKLDRTFHDRINGEWLEACISDPTQDGKFEQFRKPFSGNHSRTCESFNGARKLRCRSCGGRRIVRCTSCSNGYITCTNCDGSGMLRCISCGGSGRQDYSENVPYRGVGGQTFYRLETRTRACSGCGGKGCSIYCGCQNGSRICPYCAGRSEVQCGGCSGTGENVCSTCQGAGKEGFNLTYTPVTDENTQLACEHDQSTFDRYMREVPGFLEQKAALQRQNLKYRAEGAHGQYRYNAVAHAAQASGGETEPALILGHENMEPYRSPAYLERICARRGTWQEGFWFKMSGY
ncbi:MAG: hypothetical protein AAGL17_13435, partial [Cyanobacteria bacterium J06576_12]